MARGVQGCSLQLGRGDCPRKHTVNQEVCGTVGVMLANPNVQCVVIDRQTGMPPFIMAFSCSWNALRAKVEAKEALTRCLISGGPIEAGEEVKP